MYYTLHSFLKNLFLTLVLFLCCSVALGQRVPKLALGIQYDVPCYFPYRKATDDAVKIQALNTTVGFGAWHRGAFSWQTGTSVHFTHLRHVGIVDSLLVVSGGGSSPAIYYYEVYQKPFDYELTDCLLNWYNRLAWNGFRIREKPLNIGAQFSFNILDFRGIRYPGSAQMQHAFNFSNYDARNNVYCFQTMHGGIFVAYPLINREKRALNLKLSIETTFAIYNPSLSASKHDLDQFTYFGIGLEYVRFK